jgi:hypothetical protein
MRGRVLVRRVGAELPHARLHARILRRRVGGAILRQAGVRRRVVDVEIAVAVDLETPRALRQQTRHDDLGHAPRHERAADQRIPQDEQTRREVEMVVLILDAASSLAPEALDLLQPSVGVGVAQRRDAALPRRRSRRRRRRSARR